MDKRYVNYHSHSQYSNVATPDVAITNQDRAKRVVELGHTVLSGLEHGGCGNFLEVFDLSVENGVKPLLGSEVYFVRDRLREYPTAKQDDGDKKTTVLLGEQPDGDKIVPDAYTLTGKFRKDNTNAHIILLAKNENGRKSINRIVSEANVTGFYYKARVDLELLETLPENDVWVLTACVGGIWKYEEGAEELLVWLKKKFKDNLYLEVQSHHTLMQKVLNAKILSLSDKYGIELIAGMDSHMISDKGSLKRDTFLRSRGISYPDEIGWFLDFPDYDTVLERFREQGILSDEQAKTALDKTLIFEDVEVYDSPIFDKEKIKLPTIYPDKTLEQKNTLFSELIWSQWEKEKENVPTSRHDEYRDAIKFELDTVLETGMADYFLLNYKVIEDAVSNGGFLSLTGRGSAAGFYLCKLLGFTTVDRLSSRVKLFPERFISKERILEAKTLPDIDFNVGNPKVFEESQTRVLGRERAYRMITFQTTHPASAWKMYARAQNIPFEDANAVSEQIADYEKAVKYADDEDDNDIDVREYVNEKYHDEYEKSKDFLGLVNSLGSHPCAFLLLDEGRIDEEIGLIRTRGGEICAAIDGKTADKRLFLKNDLLKVTVVDIIYKAYAKIGMKPHTVDELIALCDGNTAVWSLYKKGATMGLNQVETESTTKKVSFYAPKNISELSSFIAAIRPSFKSNYGKYAKREAFSYGVPTLDNLIQTEEFPFSYMLYQENAMAVLGFAGIEMYETYQVVKAIGKKNHNKVYGYKARFLSLMMTRLIDVEGSTKDEAKTVSDMIWKIIEDSANYSFNAAHAYCVANDSLYVAWLKANHPLFLYETLLDVYEDDAKKDKIIKVKSEADKNFGVAFPSFKWGQDNRTIVANDEDVSITMSLSTIKGFGRSVAEGLYSLREAFDGETFLELLIFASEEGIFSKSKWEKLIRINYFSPFGAGSKKLEKFIAEFTAGKSRYGVKLKSKVQRAEQLAIIWDEMPDERYEMKELITNEIEILGDVVTKFKSLHPNFSIVLDVDTTYSPKVTMQSLARGSVIMAKVKKKLFKKRPIAVGDIVFGYEFETDDGWIKVDGEFVQTPDKTDIWMGNHRVPIEGQPLEQFAGANTAKMVIPLIVDSGIKTNWK